MIAYEFFPRQTSVLSYQIGGRTKAHLLDSLSSMCPNQIGGWHPSRFYKSGFFFNQVSVVSPQPDRVSDRRMGRIIDSRFSFSQYQIGGRQTNGVIRSLFLVNQASYRIGIPIIKYAGLFFYLRFKPTSRFKPK